MIDINELKYLIHDWKKVLIDLGIPDELLVKKGTPCPVCGGDDRFTYDNKFGKGDSYCRSCGHMDGIELLKRFHAIEFPAVVGLIADYMGVEDKGNDELKKKLDREREDRLYYQSRKYIILFANDKNLKEEHIKQADRHLKYIHSYQNKYPSNNFDEVLRKIAKKMPAEKVRFGA